MRKTPSYDAKTGASQMVEVKVAGDVSFKYTTLENGTLSVTVEELSRAYGLSELAADKVFKGKRLRVWGAVARISPSGAAKPWIVFSPEKKSEKDKDIRCAMKAPPSADLKSGVKITVEGLGAGMTFAVNVADGVVTK